MSYRRKLTLLRKIENELPILDDVSARTRTSATEIQEAVRELRKEIASDARAFDPADTRPLPTDDEDGIDMAELERLLTVALPAVTVAASALNLPTLQAADAHLRAALQLVKQANPDDEEGINPPGSGGQFSSSNPTGDNETSAHYDYLEGRD